MWARICPWVDCILQVYSWGCHGWNLIWADFSITYTSILSYTVLYVSNQDIIILSYSYQINLTITIIYIQCFYSSKDWKKKQTLVVSTFIKFAQNPRVSWGDFCEPDSKCCQVDSKMPVKCTMTKADKIGGRRSWSSMHKESIRYELRNRYILEFRYVI